MSVRRSDVASKTSARICDDAMAVIARLDRLDRLDRAIQYARYQDASWKDGEHDIGDRQMR
jgi:hypothetical protein